MPSSVSLRAVPHAPVTPAVWGRMINTGQQCIAPDFTLVHKDRLDEFGEALPRDGACASSVYTPSASHCLTFFARFSRALQALLQGAVR